MANPRPARRSKARCSIPSSRPARKILTFDHAYTMSCRDARSATPFIQALPPIAELAQPRVVDYLTEQQLQALTVDEFQHQYLVKNRPALVNMCNELATWPAARTWTGPALLARCLLSLFPGGDPCPAQSIFSVVVAVDAKQPVLCELADSSRLCKTGRVVLTRRCISWQCSSTGCSRSRHGPGIVPPPSTYT